MRTTMLNKYKKKIIHQLGSLAGRLWISSLGNLCTYLDSSARFIWNRHSLLIIVPY